MGNVNRFNLSQYNCDVYVETGTGTGSCLDYAVSSNCFNKFFSVDIEESFSTAAKNRYPFATIETGISNVILENWLSSNQISSKERVFFFLDAHFPGADFKGLKHDVLAPNAVPLESELRLIKKYRPNGNNFIICDDARIYKIDNWKSGNVEWLQVPGGMNFIHEIFGEHKVSLNYEDEGYVIIDDMNL